MNVPLLELFVDLLFNHPLVRTYVSALPAVTHATPFTAADNDIMSSAVLDQGSSGIHENQRKESRSSSVICDIQLAVCC